MDFFQPNLITTTPSTTSDRRLTFHELLTLLQQAYATFEQRTPEERKTILRYNRLIHGDQPTLRELFIELTYLSTELTQVETHQARHLTREVKKTLHKRQRQLQHDLMRTEQQIAQRIEQKECLVPDLRVLQAQHAPDRQAALESLCDPTDYADFWTHLKPILQDPETNEEHVLKKVIQLGTLHRLPYLVMVNLAECCLG